MRAVAIAAIFIFAQTLGTPARAQAQTGAGLSLTVNGVQTSPFAEAIVTLRNASSKGYSKVFIECAFLSATGEPITLANELISNVGPGQTVYGKAQIGTRPGIKSASCRISSAYP